ncbi:UDP-N-acetylmuramoyl-L-alanine--D-glutamate ligase [Candidatus Thioglobus autotrophicus]|uniref:UDP-N-acetylmuramoyl-L-alanine--D-glutamate ligase n=1 Tax=Candidatus Thioglobus autotrophicus TaxID=1705394 RepID=UPI00299D8AAF|nr:UDP-N-acetylmuramoyl-L-alanine--D-glutamate ligase [Candidatus Thioglobus autotrophicus]WPE18455.1 UDP-N-acetylmuramoyl-L-alanine--D-glutamate ligase [Candidatus Thioglobus autotrophicus]
MKLVLGLGVTGFSIARFLQQQEIAFKVADSRQAPPLLAEFLLEFPVVELSLGDWDDSVLEGVDEIFISPGIAKREAIVVWALDRGIEVVSDIELFSRYAQAPVIGITGSNGKSTVTQLLGEMIQASGQKVAVGGNIGTPALECLDETVEFYVLELSSYQLDYSKNLNLLTGVVLNITPDHLDRYDSFEQYINSKLSLYQYCQQSVVNIDEPLVPKQDSAVYFGISIPKQEQDFGTVTCHGSCYFLKGDDVLMGVDEMQLIGEHNVANILAALALGDQIGLDMTLMTDCVKVFKGLEHRLEWVTDQQGIAFYNDSKATNALASMTALRALIDKHENIVLIAGGMAKDEDYSEFFKLVDQNVFGVVLIGRSAMYFERGIHTAKTLHAQDMHEAVALARGMINKGVVLLSPACASFDMFDNFEQRGREFKRAIAE